MLWGYSHRGERAVWYALAGWALICAGSLALTHLNTQRGDRQVRELFRRRRRRW